MRSRPAPRTALGIIQLRADPGQTIVTGAMMLAGIALLAALVVQVGMSYSLRRHLQNSADAAVLAGIQELDCTDDATRLAAAESKASEYASANTSGLKSIEATADATTVFARVTKESPVVLADFFGIDISARARATVTCGGRPFGILALSEHECPALTFAGNGEIAVEGGDIIVNSDCEPNAIMIEGNNVSVSADGIYVVGEADDPHGTLDDILHENASAVPDPFEAIPTPDVDPGPTRTVCAAGGGSQAHWVLEPGTYNCGTTGLVISGPNPVTFNAGDYAFIGGLSISGNGGPVVMGRGTYVIRSNEGGTGFTYNGARNIDATGGVLFYNTCLDGSCGNFSPGAALHPFDHTCDGHSGPGETSGIMRLDGDGQIDVTPYGDPYLNVVFFMDRCSDAGMIFRGQNEQLESDPIGAIYGKNSYLNYEGQGDGSLQFVADTIRLAGNGGIGTAVQGGTEAGPAIVWSLTE